MSFHVIFCFLGNLIQSQLITRQFFFSLSVLQLGLPPTKDVSSRLVVVNASH